MNRRRGAGKVSKNFWVQGSGFRVQGSGFRVQGSGFGRVDPSSVAALRRVESCIGFAKAPVLRSSTATEEGSGDRESNRRRQGQGGRPEFARAARRRLRPAEDKTPLFTRDSVRRGVGHL